LAHDGVKYIASKHVRIFYLTLVLLLH